MKALLGVCALLFVAPPGCKKSGAADPAPAASGGAADRPDSPAIAAIRGAEAARATKLVPVEATANHDVTVRRAATRALARIADDPAGDRLERGLADEDTEVIAWAAHGLGATCAGREPAIVRALAARAASLPAEPAPSPPARGTYPKLSAEDAIADALARCGTAQAEQTLRAWLAFPAPRAERAAFALGRLAGKRRRLDDATVIALLDAAARTPPVDAALYPLGRIDTVSEPVAKRIVEVTSQALARTGDGRLFATRALGATGLAGAEPLAAVFADEKAASDVRSAAATTLGRLGPEAAPALARALAKVVPAGDIDAAWLRARYGPLSAALRALPPKSGGEEPLIRLAELSIPDQADPALARRAVELRCAAAGILANTATLSARFVDCAPEGFARVRGYATLRVLDRGALIAARFEVWRKFATGDDPGVRRAALALVPSHPEMMPVAHLVAEALSAKEPGVVAQAARILSADPRRGGTRALEDVPAVERAEPSEEVVEALGRALEAERPADEIDTRVSLAAAAGALGVLSLKPRVEKLCASDNATVRRGAESALRALGAEGALCPPPPVTQAPPMGVSRRAYTLVFVTDNGRLGVTLDGAFAPLAAARVVELAKSGFYDHMTIHRVVPGQVVQFGDKVGDGYGGSGRAPVPTETAPLEFGRYAVGMALAGRDTGSSQLFITLAPEPNLYGDYPLLGWADADWANAAEGDVIEHVEVKER